ncbi:MAG TPA: flagellar assembly protein FliW [Bryobacteraceae bacterium]|nr:flagellar assembly protein FliW [Bryobacteraceae bacterium]
MTETGALLELGSELQVASPWLGQIRWNAGEELFFPAGLPGFERCQRMVPVEIPSQRPLIYLQSAEDAEVCFVAMPVLAVWSGFSLRISEDDRAAIGAAEDAAIGMDLLCLALLLPWGRSVQANLDAPVVVNLHNGCGVQAIAPAGTAGLFRLSENGWEAAC